MEQNEVAVTDLAPKKIARQKLDFFAASPNGQPQPQPQFQLHVPSSQTPQPQIQVQPVVHRIPHPVRKLPLPPMPQSKQESPGSRLKCNLEVKDGTPKKGKQCNCRNSRCLKLYCECFASGSYCNGCNCVNCYNNVENEKFRQDAIGATLERNPNAFRPKIASSPHGSRDAREDTREAQMLGRHNKGCNCKKSGCLKKYCECFQANILCSENCKCMDCKNFEESEERKALFHGAPNGVAYIHHAANAAINGAVGCSGFVPHLSCKKRKIEEVSDMTTNYQFICNVAKSQQDYHLRNTAASSSPLSIPVSRATNGAVTGSSKLTYRSPLAGMLQFQDVMEFCSILVVLSRETANVLEGRQRDVDQQAKRENNETAASPKQEVGGSIKEHDTRKTEHDSHLNGIDAKTNESNDCGTVRGEMENGRPGSPEIDLMCHEQEMMFTKVESPTGLKKVIQSKSLKPSSENEFSAIYAEQERLILTGLQDCLNRLITCASIKETMRSPLATSKTGNPQEPAEREGP